MNRIERFESDILLGIGDYLILRIDLVVEGFWLSVGERIIVISRYLLFELFLKLLEVVIV
jgi:hypothetical protein